MQNTDTVAVSFVGILVLLGLLALAVCFVALVVSAFNKKEGSGASLLGWLLGLGLCGGGLLAFMAIMFFGAQRSVSYDAHSAVTINQPVMEPTKFVVLGIVGLIVMLVVALFVAAVRKGGGWAVLGLVLLSVPVLLLVLAWTRVSYRAVAIHDFHEAASVESNVFDEPLIEMGETVSHSAGSQSAKAEVTEWSDEVDWHGGVEEVHLEAHAAAGETVQNTAVLPAPAISHAPINLSKLPDNHPEWVDQTDGKWEDGFWRQTVQIGPYETEEECDSNLQSEVYEATKDFAEWHVAGIENADAAIRSYDRNQLPHPDIRIHNYGSTSLDDGMQSYELRTYRRGNVRETYHTKVETSVSDEPMPVILALVEFDDHYRQRVNRNVRHGLSVQRAIKAGSLWGVALLGMVITLGGVKLAGSRESTTVSAPALAAAAPPVDDLAAADVSISRETPGWVTKKNFGLILAPVICTAIYFMTTGFYPIHLNDPAFWPKWVWFGCGIAFVMKTVVPRLKQS